MYTLIYDYETLKDDFESIQEIKEYLRDYLLDLFHYWHYDEEMSFDEYFKGEKDKVIIYKNITDEVLRE